MKKYGQADVMCAVIHMFLEQHKKLTDEQKKDIEDKCCEDATDNYSTAAEWEAYHISLHFCFFSLF